MTLKFSVQFCNYDFQKKPSIFCRYSFGYDCTKRHNLHLLDERTVCFAAGNYVMLLDLQTKEQRYLRSTSGGGIGAITVSNSIHTPAVQVPVVKF